MAILEDDERATWRAFAAMRREIDRALAAQLQRDAELSPADHDVLSALLEAPGRRARIGGLAALLGWEKSRVSHQVTRMTSRGLLGRAACENDARGNWISPTEEGERALLAVADAHAAELRRVLLDPLDAAELAAIRSASAKVTAVTQPLACDELDAAE